MEFDSWAGRIVHTMHKERPQLRCISLVVLFELKMPRNAAAQRKREREKPAPINAPVEAEHLAPVHPDAFPHGIAALHGGIEDRHLGRTGERNDSQTKVLSSACTSRGATNIQQQLANYRESTALHAPAAEA